MLLDGKKRGTSGVGRKAPPGSIQLALAGSSVDLGCGSSGIIFPSDFRELHLRGRSSSAPAELPDHSRKNTLVFRVQVVAGGGCFVVFVSPVEVGSCCRVFPSRRSHECPGQRHMERFGKARHVKNIPFHYSLARKAGKQPSLQRQTGWTQFRCYPRGFRAAGAFKSGSPSARGISCVACDET